MTIDARYLIPIGMFYLPGLLLTVGTLILGFSLSEVRAIIAVFGAVFGFIAACVAGVLVSDRAPILIKIGGAK